MSQVKGGLEGFGKASPLAGERTVERTVARELRRAITEGGLEPGVRLRYRDLAKHFDVSVTPVRIALRELSHDGLIEMRPHGAARVTPLSVEELEEVYAARSGFEGWLAGWGAPSLSDDDFVTLDRRLADLEVAVAQRDVERYLRCAWSHRAVCYGAARRDVLLDKTEILFQRSARYNWLTLRGDGRLAESLAGARDFHTACRRRDGQRAKESIRQALDRTLEHLTSRFIDALDSEPGKPDPAAAPRR